MSEREAFEKYADQYDNFGDEWQDKGVDEHFIAGYRAGKEAARAAEVEPAADLNEVVHEAVATMPVDVGEDDGDTQAEHILKAIKPYTQAPASQVPDWANIHKMVDDYIEGYEFRGDDGDYHPTDQERFLIEDCVAGIMHEIQEAITTSINPPTQEGE